MSQYRFGNPHEIYEQNLKEANSLRERKAFERQQELEKERKSIQTLNQYREEEESSRKAKMNWVKQQQYEEYQKFIQQKYQDNPRGRKNRDDNLAIKIGSENRQFVKKNYEDGNNNLCLNPMRENLRDRPQQNSYFEEGKRNKQRGLSHGYNIINNVMDDAPKQTNLKMYQKNSSAYGSDYNPQPTMPQPQYGNQRMGQQKTQPPYAQQDPYDQRIPPRYNQPSSQYDQPPSQYDQPPSQYDQPPSQYTQPPSQYTKPPSKFDELPPQYNQPPSQYDQLPSQYNQPPSQYEPLPSQGNKAYQPDPQGQYGDYDPKLQQQLEDKAKYEQMMSQIEKNPQPSQIDDKAQYNQLYQQQYDPRAQASGYDTGKALEQLQREQELGSSRGGIQPIAPLDPTLNYGAEEQKAKENELTEEDYKRYYEYLNMLKKNEGGAQQTQPSQPQQEYQNYLQEQPRQRTEPSEPEKPGDLYNDYLQQQKPPQMSQPYGGEPQEDLSSQMQKMSIRDEAHNEYLANKKKNSSSFGQILNPPQKPPTPKYTDHPLLITNKIEKQKQYKEFLDSQINAKKIYKDTVENLTKNGQQQAENNPYKEMREKHSKFKEIPSNPYTNKNYNFSTPSYLSANPITNPENSYKFVDNRRVSSGRLQNLGSNIVSK